MLDGIPAAIAPSKAWSDPMREIYRDGKRSWNQVERGQTVTCLGQVDNFFNSALIEPFDEV